MTVPTEPGVYRDVRGDLWIRDEYGWTHAARRLTDDRLSPVRGYPGPITDKTMATPTGPGTEVLPLERVEPGDYPEDLL
ncbi:hypothetical protein B0T36_14665 [Nocardia donostiensis]|uniref:hypothetical protein n=1 Tax=Nocardia donostiensis TaxID=1538463 RepID=UPI0009DABCB8|nr:hypothetical protein [Nocardia donostiensis]OQS14256.1 hypothetical protein B0T36_14665 [Nocardia donostiensis]